MAKDDDSIIPPALGAVYNLPVLSPKHGQNGQRIEKRKSEKMLEQKKKNKVEALAREVVQGAVAVAMRAVTLASANASAVHSREQSVQVLSVPHSREATSDKRRSAGLQATPKRKSS